MRIPRLIVHEYLQGLGIPGLAGLALAYRTRILRYHRANARLAQLVDDRVTLVNTMTDTTLDRAGVKIKFDVYPEQIVDYLALIGDSVDNVPGVDKCGPKTAVKWLQQYGSLDDIVAHAAVARGTFYLHFQDKRGVFDELQDAAGQTGFMHGSPPAARADRPAA